MKKSVTKIVKATVALTMSIGMGVSVAATSNRDTNPVHAVNYVWQKVTSTAEFVDGMTFLITQGNYYLDASQAATDNTPRQGSLSLSDNLPTLTANNACCFTVSGSGDTIKLLKASDNTKWLITGSSNNAARINTGKTGNYWTISSAGTNQFYLMSNQSRYLSRYGTTDFRSYDNTNTNANLVLYKLVEYTPVGSYYTVSFNSNGGSIINDAYVSDSGTEKVSEPSPAPSKSGYSFVGWYSDAELNNAYNFNANVVGNITLYAKWEKVSLTASYSVSSLTNGTGYRVSGEVTAKTGASDFFIQDGNNSMQINDNALTSAVSVGNTVDLFGIFNGTKIGNLVYSEITSNDTTNSQTPLTDLSDATEANRYKYFEISPIQLGSEFNGDNRQATIKNSSVIVYYQAASCVNAGGSFNKNDYHADDFVSAKGVINKYNSTIELQITDIQKLAQRVVAFNGNAEGVSATPSQTVLLNGTAYQPSNPTRESDENYSYSFGGWYTNQGCTAGNEYNFSSAVIEDTTLYAKWNASERAAAEVVESLETTSSLSYNYSKEGNGRVDKLTKANTRGNGTDYADWTLDTLSGISYKGQSGGTNNSIQLRTNNSNSGIVTTANTNNHDVKRITIKWESHTAEDRAVEIYGSNSAYSAATDLYDDNTKGTLIDTLSVNDKDLNGEETIEINTSYKYIGIKSSVDALYLESIDIQWGVLPVYTYSDVMIRFTGTITKTLWNRLNSESTITGYGVMISNDTTLSGSELKTHYNDSPLNSNIRIYPSAQATPAELDANNYVWNLRKMVANTTERLTTNYVAVAYIVTDNDGVVFFGEETASVKSLAAAAVASDLYDEESFEGSLNHLANLA